MTKIATFADGSTDTYKGKRDVKAAWAIYAGGQRVLSGHSMDIAKARKTAESNIRFAIDPDHRNIWDRPTRWAKQIAYYNPLARRDGYKDWKDAYTTPATHRAN